MEFVTKKMQSGFPNPGYRIFLKNTQLCGKKQCKFNDSVVGNKNAGEKFSLNLIKCRCE